MHKLSKDVVATARRISQDLGWVGRQPAATSAAVRPVRATARARARGRDRRALLKQD
jgi:hypothetical protein